MLADIVLSAVSALQLQVHGGQASERDYGETSHEGHFGGIGWCDVVR